MGWGDGRVGGGETARVKGEESKFKRGCVVMPTDSILEALHLTHLHGNAKCAAYIIEHEVYCVVDHFLSKIIQMSDASHPVCHK